MRWSELDELMPRDRVPSGPTEEGQLAAIAEAGGYEVLGRTPGSHWADTSPPGGDFDIVVRSGGTSSSISYLDLLSWIEDWSSATEVEARLAMIDAIAATTLDGCDPREAAADVQQAGDRPVEVILHVLQGLALAEHRRFEDTEEEGGGRRLPAELALGILLDRWSASRAASAAAAGHVGLMQLRSDTQHLGLLPTFPEYVDRRRTTGHAPPKERLEGVKPEAEDGTKIRGEALELLRRFAGPGADFRDQQWEAIRALVLDKKRILLVQRTGWGKSAVYFIATKLLRDRGAGPTILISPLLSLMRNQVEMAQRAGITAATINASNPDDHADIYAQITDGSIDLLLMTPEWVSKPAFRANVLPSLRDTGMIVIDEIHCISDWGHDFRPDYRRLVRVVDGLGGEVAVLGTTATATKRVILDIEEQFADGFEIIRGSLARPGLSFSVFEGSTRAERLARLLGIVNESTGTGIVYCLTVPETNRVADWLRGQGVDAVSYHARLEDEQRLRVEIALLESDVRVVVATSALGMGFDKPDIQYVVHMQSPASIVEYYQQAGRAGRGIPEARAVLMMGEEDQSIHDLFARTAFVSEREAAEVLSVIRRREGGATEPQLQSEVNLDSERLGRALRLLEVEGAIRQSGYTWVVENERWSYDHERPARVSAQRQLERYAVYRYAAPDQCRMQTLMAELDDPDPSECGECDVCTGAIEAKPDRDVARAAERFLATREIYIPPKRIAPATSRNPSYRIPRHAGGRALCYLGEGEKGRTLLSSISSGSYDERVVEWSLELLSNWRMDPGSQPTWVTFVPKDEDNEGLSDVARRIAERLSLPVRVGLRKTRRTTSQLVMPNDVQRYENLSFAFDATPDVRAQPVLLVDDFISSGWTFAVTAMTLRKADVPAVIPFALARVQTGGPYPPSADPPGTPPSRPEPHPRRSNRGSHFVAALSSRTKTPRGFRPNPATIREVQRLLDQGLGVRDVERRLGLSGSVAERYVDWIGQHQD